MTVTTSPTFGIDIGAERLYIANGYRKDSEIYVINLTDPTWADQLIALVPYGAIVAYEPTGWHYSAPIVAALHQTGAHLLQVEHRTTGKARELRVSGVKKDLTDAQTLALIAEQHVLGVEYRGTHTAEPHLDNPIIGLRMLIWAYERAVKESTRITNRLHQLAHSIWPTLSQRLDTYLRAIEADAITPTELRILAGQLQVDQPSSAHPEPYKNSRARGNLIQLAADLPTWLDNNWLRDAIAYEAATLRNYRTNVTQLASLIEGVVCQEPFIHIARLWATIPRNSTIYTASLLVATHGRPATITKAQFKASVGHHPHISQSGETSQSVMARQGFRPAKKYLHLWTMQLIQHGTNPIAAEFRHHKGRGDEHAMAAARAKLCSILSALARNNQPYIYEER